MKIAIQGLDGSFHALVAHKLFSSDTELVCRDSFSKVFEALRNGAADQAVVACENSLYGSIHEVYDLLLKYRFPIIGEHTEHIHQQLISFTGTDKTTIREIYSHPVALDQCRQYLADHFPAADLIEHDDTASAVKYIKDTGNPEKAAIASSTAAEVYDMSILDANIEDEKTNLTRFVVLAKEAGQNPHTTRLSFVLTTNHSAGALYHALGTLAEYDVNMTKLESRPIRGEAFRYQFFIDADCTASIAHKAISSLEEHGNSVTVLGIF